jgi:hypothetical protein
MTLILGTCVQPSKSIFHYSKKLKKMVTVTNYAERQRKDGTTFITLEVTGGIELVQSSTTKNFYATVRKCFIPCTFSEAIAKSTIGTQIAGNIVRVEVAPYDYVNKRTGEILKLQHSYAYRPDGSMESIGETKISNLVEA